MLVLSTRIVLDLFYLLIFHSEKFSTDVSRLPYAVNVNLNLSIVKLIVLSSLRNSYANKDVKQLYTLTYIFKIYMLMKLYN